MVRVCRGGGMLMMCVIMSCARMTPSSLALHATTRIRDPRSSPILGAPPRTGLQCPFPNDARVSGGEIWAGRSVAKRVALTRREGRVHVKI